MTRYLLDTNIISNVVKLEPSESLLAWWAEQRDEDLFIASLTIAEIRRGILEKPRGKKRDALDAWFSGPQGPQALFAGRVLSFDVTVEATAGGGMVKAVMNGAGELQGIVIDPQALDPEDVELLQDMIVAAVAGANDCVIVTDNERDFDGIQVLNPIRLAGA